MPKELECGSYLQSEHHTRFQAKERGGQQKKFRSKTDTG